MTLIGTFENLIVHLVGILYPIFKSIEALENDNLDSLKLWLTYWICFSSFLIFDQIAGKLLLKKIVPFYFFIKLIFLIFLFHPRTMGAHYLFTYIFMPIIKGNVLDL